MLAKKLGSAAQGRYNQVPLNSFLAQLMNDVTQILSQIEQGDSVAAEQLLPLVYEELRKLAAARMAQENPGQTFFFAGLSVEEAGAAMGLSARTARRHWAYSRAWLFRALRQDDTATPA